MCLILAFLDHQCTLASSTVSTVIGPTAGEKASLRNLVIRLPNSDQRPRISQDIMGAWEALSSSVRLLTDICDARTPIDRSALQALKQPLDSALATSKRVIDELVHSVEISVDHISDASLKLRGVGQRVLALPVNDSFEDSMAILLQTTRLFALLNQKDKPATLSALAAVRSTALGFIETVQSERNGGHDDGSASRSRSLYSQLRSDGVLLSVSDYVEDIESLEWLVTHGTRDAWKLSYETRVHPDWSLSLLEELRLELGALETDGENSARPRDEKALLKSSRAGTRNSAVNIDSRDVNVDSRAVNLDHRGVNLDPRDVNLHPRGVNLQGDSLSRLRGTLFGPRRGLLVIAYVELQFRITACMSMMIMQRIPTDEAESVLASLRTDQAFVGALLGSDVPTEIRPLDILVMDSTDMDAENSNVENVAGIGNNATTDQVDAVAQDVESNRSFAPWMKAMVSNIGYQAILEMEQVVIFMQRGRLEPVRVALWAEQYMYFIRWIGSRFASQGQAVLDRLGVTGFDSWQD